MTTNQNHRPGQHLTPTEADQQILDSTLTGRDRYKVYGTPQTGWQVWDHEDATTVADRDGRTDFDRWDDIVAREERRYQNPVE